MSLKKSSLQFLSRKFFLSQSKIDNCTYYKSFRLLDNTISRPIRLTASETTSTSERETISEPYLLYPKSSYLSKKPLEFWKIVLKALWDSDHNTFNTSVHHQVKKVRQKGANSEKTYESTMEFLKASPDHTVAIHLGHWKRDFICIDIDIPIIGEKLLNLFSKDRDRVEPLLGCPLIVKTETPGHIHLYYEAPSKEAYYQGYFKTFPSRLGFKCSYVRTVITVAGQQRIPIIPYGYNIKQISDLPEILYPYNYYSKDGLFTLIEKKYDNKGNLSYEAIQIGSRNKTLFEFCRVDIFSRDHMQLISWLCFKNPLTSGEVLSTSKSIGNYHKKNTNFVSKLKTFSIAMNKEENSKKCSPEFMTSENSRLNKAKKVKTTEEVINFVFYMEETYSITLADDQWIGKFIDYVVIYVLLSQEFISIRYITEEHIFVVWQGTFWQNSTDNEVLELLYNAACKLKYGGVEQKITQRTVMFPLRKMCTVQNWPHITELKGHNYLNGIVYYEESKLVIKPHKKEFLHRSILNCNFTEDETLDLPTQALISDICHGKQAYLHYLRYQLFLMLNTSWGNIGFMYFGPGGGGKSVFTTFARELLPYKSVGTIDNTLINKAPSAKNTLVKDKLLIILPDISNQSLSSTFIEFIKLFTGRDQIATDAKYKDASQFVGNGFMIATSNVAPSNMRAFRDGAFASRFVQFPIPGITSSEKINNASRVFTKKKDQLIHWGMTINKSFVKKNIRADAINAINGFNLTDIEHFLIERVCYCKGEYTSTKELSDAYELYKTDNGDSEPQKKSNYSQLMGRTIPEFAEKLITRQARSVAASRNSKNRGWTNITLKANSGLLKDNQEGFKFKVDPELLGLLDKNPFTNHGYLSYDRQEGFTQIRNTDFLPMAKNTLLATSVHNQGLSTAQALTETDLQELPFVHLFNSLVDTRRLKDIRDSSWFKLNRSLILKDPKKPNKLISDESLNNQLNSEAESLAVWFRFVYSKHYQHYDKGESCRLNFKKSSTFKLTKDSVNYKLRESPTFRLPKDYGAFRFRKSPTFQLTNTDTGRKDTTINKDSNTSNNNPDYEPKDPNFNNDAFDNSTTDKQSSVGTDVIKPKRSEFTSNTKSEINNDTEPIKPKPNEPKEPKRKRGRPRSNTSKKVNNQKEDIPIDTITQPGTEDVSLITEYDKSQIEIETKDYNEQGSFDRFVISNKEQLINIRNQYADWFSQNKTLNNNEHFAKCLLFVDNQQENFDTYDLFKPLFDSCLDTYQKHVKFVIKKFKNLNYLLPYYNYKVAYKDAFLINALVTLFREFPLYGPLKIINAFNDLYGPTILDSWALNATSRPRESEDYYNKQFSGTSPGTLINNQNITLQAVNEVNLVLDADLSFIMKGWSLFPFLYKPGSQAYGRIGGLPNPGLSSIKSEVKSTILKFLSNKTACLKFVELDIKSCHTVIAFSFFNVNNVKVPKTNDLWPTLIKQFDDAYHQIVPTTNEPLKDILHTLYHWPENSKKSLLKTQWYKALNNGSTFNASDNIEKAYVKLKISKEHINLYKDACSLLFKGMPLLKEVNNLQKDLSNQNQIYLPTSYTPFNTKTRSKTQLDNDRDSDSSMTAMSRLFTNIEIIVVIMIWLTVANSGFNLLPISYESDGLLLVGEFDEESMPEMINTLNKNLNKYVANIFRSEFSLEFKNPTLP